MRLVAEVIEHTTFALKVVRLSASAEELTRYVTMGRRVVILEASAETLELIDPGHAMFIDEVEVGRCVAGHIRVAFKVEDSIGVTQTLEETGAAVLTRWTPWNPLNARLEGPAALQLT